MALTHTDTTVSNLKINRFASYDDFAAAYAQELIGADEISFIDETSASDIEFTHTANTTVSDSTATITFAAEHRCSQMITVSADIGLTFAVNNLSDNYLWIANSGSADIDVTISAVTLNGTSVRNVYVPTDGITVPAGGVCELGVIANSDGAFITSRNDLAI